MRRDHGRIIATLCICIIVCLSIVVPPIFNLLGEKGSGILDTAAIMTGIGYIYKLWRPKDDTPHKKKDEKKD